MRRLVGTIFAVLLVSQCGPKTDSTVTGPSWQPVPVKDWPMFADMGDRELLTTAIDRQLNWLNAADRDWSLTVDNRNVNAEQLKETLRRFRQIWKKHGNDQSALQAAIEAEFSVYLWNWNGSPDILFTGYHAPIYPGSLQADDRFRYPLYKAPKDRVQILPRQFHERMLQAGTALRGEKVVARVNQDGNVVPYFSREEIDGDGALANRGLELVYLDDYFNQFLFHVQGGGFVSLPDGRYMKLNYAGKNGHPYTSIGKVLVEEEIIPLEKVSIQAIEAYFAEKPDQVLPVCYRNASYVFYETDGTTHEALHPDLFPHGVLGFPVTPGRSIATDKKYMPGGSLVFVTGQQRQRQGDPVPFSAFAIDQDTGGAIRENHIDFFQGAGPDAEEKAGLLKDDHGRVYLLLLREDAS